MEDEGDTVELGGVSVMVCRADGAPIAGERDATDLIGLTFGSDIAVVAVPAARFDPEFFRLASGLLGAVTQKFVNYRRRLAIVGDVSAFEARSTPFRDFVRETNKGRHVWFVADMAALERKLAAPA
jgi:hypothetical protein